MQTDFMHFKSLEETKNIINGNLGVGVGVFDGIHIGHQAIVSTIVKESIEHNLIPSIITFDPHPKHFFSKDSALFLLMSNSSKVEKFKELGIKCVITLKFDKDLANLSHNEFLKMLIKCASVKKICVGENWKFGVGGLGNTSYLESMQKEYGYDFLPIKQLKINDNIVSSTGIRRLFSEGLFQEAYEMFGYDYCMEGFLSEGCSGSIKCKIVYGIVPHRLGCYGVNLFCNGKVYKCLCRIDRDSIKENSFVVEEVYGDNFSCNLQKKILIKWFNLKYPQAL